MWNPKQVWVKKLRFQVIWDPCKKGAVKTTNFTTLKKQFLYPCARDPIKKLKGNFEPIKKLQNSLSQSNDSKSLWTNRRVPFTSNKPLITRYSSRCSCAGGGSWYWFPWQFLQTARPRWSSAWLKFQRRDNPTAAPTCNNH